MVFCFPIHFNRPDSILTRVARPVLISLVCFTVVSCLTAQVKTDSGPVYHFNGAVSATNNGISLIPTFSLGKPATIIELNAGGEHLTFEPQFRISLEGQPGHLASQRQPISTISLKNTFRYHRSGIKIQVYNNYFCTMLSVRPKCKNPSLHVGIYVF